MRGEISGELMHLIWRTLWELMNSHEFGIPMIFQRNSKEMRWSRRNWKANLCKKSICKQQRTEFAEFTECLNLYNECINESEEMYRMYKRFFASFSYFLYQSEMRNIIEKMLHELQSKWSWLTRLYNEPHKMLTYK